MLGWELGSRGDVCCKRLIDRVDDGECDFITDEWEGFFRLLPEDRHFFGKDITFPIEAANSDVRHRLARFIRRGKATSRSKEMVDKSLRITHQLQNNAIINAMLAPILSFFS